MIWFQIILVLYILIGIYDLYLYAIKKVLTVTQRIHALVKKYPKWIRMVVTFILLPFSWYLGGIQVFIPTLSGWLLCHLIGWDF